MNMAGSIQFVTLVAIQMYVDFGRNKTASFLSTGVQTWILLRASVIKSGFN